ncbi:transcriptional regulator, ArsR family [Candidatus Atelocyanobacterium thalassa isolate ALOHA]|jgi:DNA-binding transcriptional ArsR family regulator|uniref:Transcriptional regulator, ArsR family n=2 Tax=Candidatus Atelocyanobacterium thalassae TaxID=713887 RepID=D3EQW3_ATETH|nr:transcriptional regulator, ArsR family [Candidatus Atelocyanobacterium thalassa isolate ALOHA]|tara:strand:- start:448 stop:864 length:417 start_codon:yes stop_codon:yes gene_type:complete
MESILETTYSQYTPKMNFLEKGEISNLSPAVLTMIADFFKVLSEVSRLQIICALKNGGKNVSQIIEITELGQANVSKHLKVLSQAGIVTRTQEGVNVFYAIANPLVFSLCDLVCNSVAIQLQQKNQQLESIKTFQKIF